MPWREGLESRNEWYAPVPSTHCLQHRCLCIKCRCFMFLARAMPCDCQLDDRGTTLTCNRFETRENDLRRSYQRHNGHNHDESFTTSVGSCAPLSSGHWRSGPRQLAPSLSPTQKGTPAGIRESKNRTEAKGVAETRTNGACQEEQHAIRQTHAAGA